MSKTYIEVAPNGIASGAVSRTVQPGSAMAAHIQVNLGTATAVAIEGAIINTERTTAQNSDFVEYDRITSSGIHPVKVLPSVYRFRAIGGDAALVAVVHYPDAKMVPDVLPPSKSDIESLVDPLVQPIQALAEQADGKADSAMSALSNLTLAVLATRGQADGAQLADGSRWLWQANGTPDGALIVAASDGGVWRRELGPGNLISVNWFSSAGGVMDQAALDRWAEYTRVNGGRFVFMPGTAATGKISMSQPLKYFSVAGHGASLTSPDAASPAVLIQEAYAGGDISGLTISHAGIGTSAPLSDLDPRRTPGGHGIMVIGGKNWSFGHNNLTGIASMGMLLIFVNSFTVTGNNVEATMGDGIHAAYGCRRGTIVGNNVLNTGDDGIPIVSGRIWPAGIPASVGTGGEVAPSCADITVVGNTVTNSAARGICFAGGERLSASGNIVNTTRKAGIILMMDEVNDTLALSNCTVSNNHVAGAGTYNPAGSGGRSGIWVRAGAANILLEANHVHDSGEEGVLIQDAAAVQIKGGYYHDNTLDGLRVVGALSSSAVVSGGTFRTNRKGIQLEISCEVEGVTCMENREDGVAAVGAGVLAAVLNSSLRFNGTSANQQASSAAGAILELHNTRVRGGRLYGLVANDGSTVRAVNCDLRDSGTTAIVAGGTGVIASLRSLGQADIGTIS